MNALGFGLGFRVLLSVLGLGFWDLAKVFGFRVSGFGLGFRVFGFRLVLLCLGLRDLAYGFGLRDLGFG